MNDPSRAKVLVHIALFALTAGLALHASADVAPPTARVAIPAAGRSNAPAPLVGFVFRPPNGGPHPAVVMLHGCGGAYARTGELNARHRMWGEFLAERGYVTLMVDSFTSRNLKELCTIRFADRPLKESDRVGDAYAALEWLRAQPDVDGSRVVLLGWSHGGGVTLDAMTHRPSDLAGFRAAVAFYPGCTARSAHAGSFTLMRRFSC